MMKEKRADKLATDMAYRDQLTNYQKVLAEQKINVQEINVNNELEWKIGKWTLFKRTWKRTGKTPIYTLRQHASNFIIYYFGFIYGLCAFLLINTPDRTVFARDPDGEPRSFGVFWGFIDWVYGSVKVTEISTGGIGWAMLSMMIGLVTMMVVGVTGRK